MLQASLVPFIIIASAPPHMGIPQVQKTYFYLFVCMCVVTVGSSEGAASTLLPSYTIIETTT